MCKVLEVTILDILKDFMCSGDMTCNRHLYCICNSTVLMCFIDASKAFDRVQNTNLFLKMVHGTMANCKNIVRIRILSY